MWISSGIHSSYLYPEGHRSHIHPLVASCVQAGSDVSLRAVARHSIMSSAELMPPSPDAICAELREQTLQACRVARIAAGIVAEGIATGVASLSDGVREREKELDTLDRLIDQGVTSIITKVDEDAGPRTAGVPQVHHRPGAGRRPPAELQQSRCRSR